MAKPYDYKDPGKLLYFNMPLLEPNCVESTYRGFDICALRHPRYWHWCGYVNTIIPLTEDQRESLRVHGGISYYDKAWLGFDCGHSGDFSPGEILRTGSIAFLKESYALIKADPRSAEFGTYRSLDYVMTELKALVDQITSVPSVSMFLLLEALQEDA